MHKVIFNHNNKKYLKLKMHTIFSSSNKNNQKKKNLKVIFNQNNKKSLKLSCNKAIPKVLIKNNNKKIQFKMKITKKNKLKRVKFYQNLQWWRLKKKIIKNWMNKKLNKLIIRMNQL